MEGVCVCCVGGWIDWLPVCCSVIKIWRNCYKYFQPYLVNLQLVSQLWQSQDVELSEWNASSQIIVISAIYCILMSLIF